VFGSWENVWWGLQKDIFLRESGQVSWKGMLRHRMLGGGSDVITRSEKKIEKDKK
jgi:hypothetical protein